MSTVAPSKEISPSDAAYLVQCLQHGSSSVVVNVPAIAAALSTKPHNVTCRISSLRKKYGLNIACTSASSGSGPATSATPSSAGKTKAAATASTTKKGGVMSGRVGKAGAGAGAAATAGKGKKKAQALPAADANGEGGSVIKEEKTEDLED